MASIIKKLPAVFNTPTEKSFFNATFDQVFSKKDSDLISGYIGRRDPGLYNPITDFYVPEPDKNRTWWQLEATTFALNSDGTKSNIFFYDDLLNRIDYYGGNTLNQDRLFESDYYSWAPPIDYDMFINYYNYYWVEHGLVTINITGISDLQIDAFIVGQSEFNTSSIAGALPNNLEFTTGIKVQFVGSVEYPDPMTIENIGSDIGIRLVSPALEYIAGTIFEFLPWDGTIQLSTGRNIVNTNWDIMTWDTEPQPGNADYITIERGAIDRNAWSRTNSWYHIDAIKETVITTGTAWPITATRALRPIIQFSADLILYDSGTQFKSDITYGFRDDASGNPLLLSNYQGELRHTINTNLGIEITDGDVIVFMNDVGSTYDFIPWDGTLLNGNWDILSWVVKPSSPNIIVNQQLFKISIDLITDIVTFIPYLTTVINGDIVFANDDSPYDGTQQGQTWYFNIDSWLHAENDKVSINQPPLFQLYDHKNTPLDDLATYPESTFAGSKIFAYKINPTPGATVDPILKFPIVYTSLGQSTDIVFQNSLMTDRYVYSAERLPINGYYYYMFKNNNIIYNNWNLYQPDTVPTIIPMYALSAPLSAIIGQSITITLTTTDVIDNTLVPYIINGSGITSADINGAPLNGNFLVINGSANIVLTITPGTPSIGVKVLHLALNSNLSFVNIIINESI